MKYFIKPATDMYSSTGSSYTQGYKTYTEYNYLRPGIIPYIKSHHFDTALELTKKYFHKVNVIDFGCADGAFIPSLSRYFPHVCAIDKRSDFLRTASVAVNAQNLRNVELLYNNGLTISDMKSRLSDRKYHVLYLLEVLEHIGEKDSLYDSKVSFLKNVSLLIDKDGVIVISVPVMIGIPFIIQRLGLALTRSHRQPISWRDFFRAALLNNTDELEKQWNGGHLGFNHSKLENRLKKDFQILRKRHIIFQVLYIIKNQA